MLKIIFTKYAYTNTCNNTHSNLNILKKKQKCLNYMKQIHKYVIKTLLIDY